MREVKIWFQTQPSVSCLGVVIEPGKFGVISRFHLNEILVSRGLDPAILDTPIQDLMIDDPVVVEINRPIGDVVTALVTEKGHEESFLTDIVVRDDNIFVGLISVRDLIVDHIEDLMHRLTAMEAQQAALVKRNKELFRDSFRQVQVDQQFQILFDHLPLPVASFDQNGRLINVNPRFAHIHQSKIRNLQAGYSFNQIFETDFDILYNELSANWREQKVSQPVFRQLNMIPEAGPTFSVEICTELAQETGLVILSIVQIGQGEMEPAEALHQVFDESEEKSAGKITQAIQLKLEDEKAIGLARSVASNLIDKEHHIDSMMKKLESIIDVAEKIEDRVHSPDTETPENSNHLLNGDLSEFSIIDLCQILVQGTKTGHLIITDPDEKNHHIYFDEGVIIHAETADRHTGVNGLKRIVNQRNGSFNFKFDENSPMKTIHGDSMGNLMQACQSIDEDTG